MLNKLMNLWSFEKINTWCCSFQPNVVKKFSKYSGLSSCINLPWYLSVSTSFWWCPPLNSLLIRTATTTIIHIFFFPLSPSPVSHKHEDPVTLNPFRKSDFSKLRHNSATNQRAPLPLYRLLTKRSQENRKLILGEWFWDIIFLNIQSIDNIKGRTL